MSILGAPALHFLVAGAALFAAVRAAEPDTPRPGRDALGESTEIVIDAGRIRGLRRGFALTNGGPPSERELRALVESAVSEEVLFREALARGLEQGDRSVAWRLAEKLEFLGEAGESDAVALYEKGIAMGLHRGDPVVRRILVEKLRLLIGRAGAEPSEDELEEYYRTRRGEYAQPERITFRHAFFSRDRRGATNSREDAAAAAAAQGAEPATEGVPQGKRSAAIGDPFVAGSRLSAQSRLDVTKLFGPAFADSAFELPVGRWSGPVESSFGWHAVIVDRRIDAREPALVEVRSRVLHAFEAERREERVRSFLSTARERYSVVVDEAALAESADA